MKDIYGLVGYPLSHSFSRKFFTDKFENENIDAEYLNFELSDISDVKKIMHSNPNLRGVNVTIPYKETVIPLLDNLDENARKIGAVNTIKVIRESGTIKYKGYNTDITGFQRSLEPLLKGYDSKALILGTGGAAKAVYHALSNLSIIAKYVSRNKRDQNTIHYKDIDEGVLKEYLLIINATPSGMFPATGESPKIPYECLTSEHFLYDLIYNPQQTGFLEMGLKKGTQIKNGEEMLKLQALAAWEIWSR